MRAHEETWNLVSDGSDVAVILPDTKWNSGNTVRLVHRGATHGQIKLAAQAPAMARLLLECQYVEMSDERGGYEQRCAICLNRETLPPDAKGHVFIKEHLPQHAPDCEIVAVLRAAGVLE